MAIDLGRNSFETPGATASPVGGVINLSKGQKINLTKEAPGLKKIMFGLGWKTQEYDGQEEYDLDASVFMQDKNGRCNESGFIFYNNLIGPNESVKHMGDNRVGEDAEDADAEQIYIDLDLVPADIQTIAVSVTIDDAERKRQNFGAVQNAYCRIINDETGQVVARFDLGEDFSVETAVVVGEIYRHNGDWKFNPIGQGFSNGLLGLCNKYGLQAEYR